MRIVVFTHQFDRFMRWGFQWPPHISYFLLYDVLVELRGRGHRWDVVVGPRPAKGDVAILHVDSTVVGEDYLSLAAGFRHTINFGASDISKRRVSGAGLQPADDWAGPVIVKTDRNYMGKIEANHNRVAAKRGLPRPHEQQTLLDSYQVLDSIRDVPDAIWANRDLVVEKFIPEPDKDGFALRTWVFMGTRERCTRHISRDRFVKARDFVRRESVEVPEALRAERRRLGFDFGKFDFVMHEGQPILLDANRTPSSSPAVRKMLKAGAGNLADGLMEMVAGA